MDPRTIVCGVLAGLALVCGTILAAFQLANGYETSDIVAVGGLTFSLAGTLGGYVVGLNSSPQAAPPADLDA